MLNFHGFHFVVDACTSCDVKEDKSAYWVPQLYVAPADATGQSEDAILGRGGIPVPTLDGNSFIIYYKLITQTGEKSNNDPGAWETISAFPEDFKMFASERLIKEKSKTVANVFDSLVTYKCLGYGDQLDTTSFPEDPSLCTGGLRAQITLPSCWDGQNSDSADHTSHVTYPTGSWAGSPCPASHPVRIPTLFYEVIYNTASVGSYLKDGWKLMFPGVEDQFRDNGDPLFHADFMNGWDQNFLNQALGECGVTPCSLIQKQFSSCVKGSEDVSEPVLPDLEPGICEKIKRTTKTWELLFSDEFDGDSLDKSKWNYEEGDGCDIGICNWGNDEFQYYSNSSRYAYVRDGKLVIQPRYETGLDAENLKNYCRSRCSPDDQQCLYRCDYVEFSSARLTTKGKFDIAPGFDDYGLIKIDVKYRVSAGDGLWPAIWMLPTDSMYGTWAASGEIDIFEAANDMSICHGTIHYGGTWPQNTFYGKTTRFSPDRWHRTTFYWDNVSMRWRLDGRQFLQASTGCGTTDGWYSVPSNGMPNTLTAPFDQKFHLLINMAVGGRFTGSIPYPAAMNTLLNPDEPKTFEIDWIRAYGMK